MSQLTSEVKEIEGKKYTIFYLPAMESHELLMDVLKMIGPTLGPAIDALVTAKGLDAEVDENTFTKITTSLFGGLDKTVIRQVIDSLKRVTDIDGVPLKDVFERVFTGDTGLFCMYSWIAFGMKVQWGKSLAALVGSAAGFGGLAKMLFPFQNT